MLRRTLAISDRLCDDAAVTEHEREVVQDWIARRYLQVHVKIRGRRYTDLPLGDFSGNVERYIQWQRQQQGRV